MKKKNTPILIGLASSIDAMASALHKANQEFRSINPPETKPDLVINGIDYFRKENKSFSVLRGLGIIAPKKLPQDVDVIKEFELIQNKKSNLSRAQREEVVFLFNCNFETR